MMKIFTHLLVFALFSLTSLADWREPLSDSAVGETATGKGWLVLQNAQQYAVIVRTDTGIKIYLAVLPAELDVRALLGRPARITAIIRESRKSPNEPPPRFLEITALRLLDAKP